MDSFFSVFFFIIWSNQSLKFPSNVELEYMVIYSFITPDVLMLIPLNQNQDQDFDLEVNSFW